MTGHLRFIAWVIVIAVGGSMVRGQDAAPAPVEGAPAAPAPIINERLDPAVATIVESNPQTPGQLLRAAAILADLGRADLAKKYLVQLAEARPDEAALAEAAGRVDPDRLLRLATNPAVQPEGQQLVDAALTAAARLTRNPARLQREIDQLADPSASVQRKAIASILAAHEDAAPELIIALADENRRAVHPLAKYALVKLDSEAVPALVTTLQSNNPALMVRAIDTLAKIGSRDTIIYLAGPAVLEHYPEEVRQAARAALREIGGINNPTREDAAVLLKREVQRYFNHQWPHNVDTNGKVAVWHWDATQKLPVREYLPAEVADATIAGRILGIDLLRLAPEDRAARQLVTVSTLDWIDYSAAPDDVQKRRAIASGFQFSPTDVSAIEDALAFAMDRGHLCAARAAAEILGQIGDASLVRAQDGVMRPLVRAVRQGNRRLRFAAAEAIMNFKPTGQFAGSSDLMQALVYFADSPGVRRAIVAFPTPAISTQLAGMLREMGYEVNTVSNGHAAYLQALTSGDYELILLSGRIDSPPVWVTLQQLRHEPEVAQLPIGLLAETGDVPYLESVASEDGSNRSPPRSRNLGGIAPAADSEFGDGSFTWAFERPLTPEGMKFFIERLIARAGQLVVPAAVREKQAVAAIGWIKQLNDANPQVFDIRPFEAQLIRALNRPATSAGAAELLAAIGSHRAQRSLLAVANSATQPLTMRQAAAAAFSRAVREYGIQLTGGELQHQYDRYNQTAFEDEASQQLLGLTLDAIELPTKRHVPNLNPAIPSP